MVEKAKAEIRTKPAHNPHKTQDLSPKQFVEALNPKP